ncbi:ssrAB-activated protein, partial [Citrobacter sp. TBCS-14]
ESPAPAVASIDVAKVDSKPLPELTPSLPLHRADVIPPVKKEKPVEGPVV